MNIRIQIEKTKHYDKKKRKCTKNEKMVKQNGIQEESHLFEMNGSKIAKIELTTNLDQV